MVVARHWLVLLLLALSAWGGAETPSREFQLKAAFLYNFAQFVEWPASAFATDDAPIRIGVLGDDPFGSAIEDIVRGEAVRGRKLVISRSARLDELKDCQILYFGRSEKPRVSEELAALDSRPVLTVSDLDGFATRGGVIRFYVEGNKIRFEINQGAAQDHGLKLSAQLLGLGRLVKTEREEERK